MVHGAVTVERKDERRRDWNAWFLAVEFIRENVRILE